MKYTKTYSNLLTDEKNLTISLTSTRKEISEMKFEYQNCSTNEDKLIFHLERGISSVGEILNNLMYLEPNLTYSSGKKIIEKASQKLLKEEKIGSIKIGHSRGFYIVN